jgi:hypothetical protein
MRSFQKHLALALAALSLVASVPVRAATQDHVASASDMAQALKGQTQADAQRSTILGLLQRAEVRSLAARSGLDLRRAESAARVLEGDELASLAQRAAEVDAALAGGAQQTITIGVVTLLLIIIIIILLVK